MHGIVCLEKAVVLWVWVVVNSNTMRHVMLVPCPIADVSRYRHVIDVVVT